MDQSPALYAESSVAQVVAPWLTDHLPRLDPTVVYRLVQLTTGILEHQSLLIEEIARGSAFRATAESNAMQVRRIVRDTRMTQMQAPTRFPKGVPQPPTTPTDYTIYIAAKQWQKVAEAMKNPEDKLIVEGFAAFDPALEGMAVFVTNATTKLLQQQKR